MFDYSKLTPRVFEEIAKYYLTSRYPDFCWEITPSSGDGNKDIICKYRVLGQEYEYWAEAKFTKSTKPHTLLKGQLDPTLVSALLSSKPVSLCFISNNQMTETYLYRLKDFKIKTNIGIELILKDEFENWLINNPEILHRYNIKAITFQESKDYCDLQIYAATITDIYNCNQYKIENHLIENTIYYLYVIIGGIDTANVEIKISNEFIFPVRSRLLDNPQDFSVRNGKHVYKFEILPLKACTTDLVLNLIKDTQIQATFTLPNIVITKNREITLSYMKQEKTLQEITAFIYEGSNHNFLIPIIGNGSTGKTKLIQKIYEELETNNNILMYSFVGNEYLDMKVLIQIFLFFNIGNVFDYDKELLNSQIDTLHDKEQKIYFSRLIEGYFESPENCINYLKAKSKLETFNFLYPSHSRVKQIILIDDIHKGDEELLGVFKKFLEEFLRQQNNQIIIFATRAYHKNFVIEPRVFHQDWIKSYCLDGLTKEDKLNTINYYMSFSGDIKFDRVTDDLIIFSNILFDNIQQLDNQNEIISINTKLARSFENPKIVNTFLYKEQLNQLTEYHDIIEFVFYISFGIEYSGLIQYFSCEKVNFLIERKIFKRIGRKIYPYHDYYVKAFFENHEVSDTTINVIKRIYSTCENDDLKFLYLSLLVRSSYNVCCQIEEEAHELEYHFFKITDYYKAYILAKAFEQYMNFDELLSFQEIYDLFILAVSSGYFMEPKEVKEQYNKVIKYSHTLEKSPSIYGIILRAQSEIVNIDYWELNLDGLDKSIDRIFKHFPSITIDSPDDLICAYLNLLNRKMVLQLLFEKYDQAEIIFNENISKIKHLKKPEYIGYLYMDYAKGIYNCNLDKALDYMQKAKKIFENLKTEYRRLLDCSCEVAYLKCLIDKNLDLSELEYTADLLNKSHFVELYSKAKLKIVALKMVRNHYPVEEIKQELYLSEYVLDYSLTGRIAILYKMVKNAFCIYAGETNKQSVLSTEEKKKIYTMGVDYQRIWENNSNGIKRKIEFMSKDYLPNTYVLDTRIW